MATIDERQLAKDLFNDVWRLMESSDRGPDDDAAMVHRAHASVALWARVGTEVNQVRGEWQVSRVYCVLGRAEPALYHARRAYEMCTASGIGDWDLAYCHEALARAHAVAGDWGDSARWLASARVACEAVGEAEDRDAVLADLGTVAAAPA